MKKSHLIINIKIFAIFIALLSSFTYSNFDDEDDFELIKNLELYHMVLKELNINYVDDIDAAKLITFSIDEMLESLDPYTVYYPESKIEDYRYFSKAEYAGLGIRIDSIDGEFTIVHVIENSPAHHHGLLIGDIILKIEDIDLEDKELDELSNLLKGEADAPVDLLIKRGNQEKPFTVEVIRKKIKLPTVSHYGVLENNVGYIKLDRFTEDASREVKGALLELKKNENITSLILDLRNNPGGYLSQAVAIVNLFVEKDVMIVEMKGKASAMNKTYKTENKPYDTEMPLVVLVNERSASASEIVSGALQDLDRAIIIGEQTYGKGLVQSTKRLKYNAQMKLTTAKYYIPSGRCVQAIDYANDKKNSKNIPDSLLTPFKTKNGRTVYEGKGVKPDIIIDLDKRPEVVKALINQKTIFKFATNFRLENDTILETADNYKFTDFESFMQFLAATNFDRETSTEKEYNELIEALKKQENSENILSKMQTFEADIKNDDLKEVQENKAVIQDLISEEIAKRYYFAKGKTQNSQNHDIFIKKAIETITNIEIYNNILK